MKTAALKLAVFILLSTLVFTPPPAFLIPSVSADTSGIMAGWYDEESGLTFASSAPDATLVFVTGMNGSAYSNGDSGGYTNSSYTIPSVIWFNKIEFDVTTINSDAFRDCVAIEHITVPESISFVGQLAFEGCAGLTALELPGVTDIRSGAFSGCTALADFSAPKLIFLEDYVFEGTVVSRLEFPSLNYVVEEAFKNAGSLTYLTISGNASITDGEQLDFTGTALRELTLLCSDTPTITEDTIIGADYLQKITYQLTPPTGLTLDENGMASWDTMPLATGYEVQLYRIAGDVLHPVGDPATRNMYETGYDFKEALQSEGVSTEYCFQVKATYSSADAGIQYEDSAYAQSNQREFDLTPPRLTDGVFVRRWANGAVVQLQPSKDCTLYFQKQDNDTATPAVPTNSGGVSYTKESNVPAELSVYLPTEESWYVYIQAVDAFGNKSDVLKIDIPAYGTGAPQLTEVSAAPLGITPWLNVTFTASKDCTVYYYVSLVAPDADGLEQFVVNNGSAVERTAGTHTITAAQYPIEPDTWYYVYLVAMDSEGYSSGVVATTSPAPADSAPCVLIGEVTRQTNTAYSYAIRMTADQAQTGTLVLALRDDNGRLMKVETFPVEGKTLSEHAATLTTPGVCYQYTLLFIDKYNTLIPLCPAWTDNIPTSGMTDAE